jgi:hypothetical protein
VDVEIDRSNFVFDISYAPTRRLYARGRELAEHSRRPEGRFRLRRSALSVGGVHLATALRAARPARRVKCWQVGGGLAYDIGPADVFASVSSYVWGRDSHDGEAMRPA